MMNNDVIAEIVYAAYRAYSEFIGAKLHGWDDIDAVEQGVMIETVNMLVADPFMTAVDLYEAWRPLRVVPVMPPWRDAPEELQLVYAMMHGVVRAFTNGSAQKK